jgi:hypothetical protein
MAWRFRQRCASRQVWIPEESTLSNWLNFEKPLLNFAVFSPEQADGSGLVGVVGNLPRRRQSTLIQATPHLKEGLGVRCRPSAPDRRAEGRHGRPPWHEDGAAGSAEGRIGGDQ